MPRFSHVTVTLYTFTVISSGAVSGNGITGSKNRHVSKLSVAFWNINLNYV